MKIGVMIFAAFAALTGSCAIQATKEYVDKRDAASVADSKVYTDIKLAELVRDLPTKDTLKPLVDDIIKTNISPWAREKNKPHYTFNEVGALSDKTFIPKKVSDIENDLEFVDSTTFDIEITNKLSKSGDTVTGNIVFNTDEITSPYLIFKSNYGTKTSIFESPDGLQFTGSPISVSGWDKIVKDGYEYGVTLKQELDSLIKAPTAENPIVIIDSTEGAFVEIGTRNADVGGGLKIGNSSYAKLEVGEDNSSIKPSILKGGKEVATEEFVTNSISGKLTAFVPETESTTTYGTTSRSTRIGGNSIELYGGSTFVSGTLKPVRDTLFKNPHQVLFKQLGNINLVDLINQCIQADSSSGVMVTTASFAFTNSDGNVVFAPYVPNSERAIVSTDKGVLKYRAPDYTYIVGSQTGKSGEVEYEVDGVRYFRAPDKDVPTRVRLTDSFTNSVENAATDAANALLYSHAIHSYMTGTTNSYFAATNYVFGADAEARTKFEWEDGMDASTVPASMALYEIRDGVKQKVWDQRDWTKWYWSFKARQMSAEIAASNDVIKASITNDANNAWAKRYAATGRVNPDPNTTYIDTKAVCLSPGMNWETVATVGGCAYWTIVGDGAVIGGSGTNAVLEIKDFEGNSVLKITKGGHQLAWLDKNDFVDQLYDSDGMICFDMLADVQPVGYFSTTLEATDFVIESDDGCPADYRWEDLGNNRWRIHYLLKPGIDSRRCFAKFQVEVEGKTKVEYGADVEIKGGLIYNGVKIAPVIPSGASDGTTITWKVIN